VDEAVPESVVVERVTGVELEQPDTNAAAVRTTTAALGRFVMSAPPAPATSTTYFSPTSDASEAWAQERDWTEAEKQERVGQDRS
jgi:hypothetical protein